MRQLLPPQNAIVGIDLADCKQAVVVTDHDSRVIARRRVTARAWELGELLDWAFGRAKAAGFESVTVACEPTGHSASAMSHSLRIQCSLHLPQPWPSLLASCSARWTAHRRLDPARSWQPAPLPSPFGKSNQRRAVSSGSAPPAWYRS